MMIPHHSVRYVHAGFIVRCIHLFSPFIAAKGKFIAEQGLRGFALWEASSDSNNLLVDAITNAIGVKEVSC